MKERRWVFLREQDETVQNPLQPMLRPEPKLPRQVQQPQTMTPSSPESDQKLHPSPYMALKQSFWAHFPDLDKHNSIWSSSELYLHLHFVLGELWK